MKDVGLVPPDGGYGWVIVFASILNNFLMVALIQNVGMFLKDKMLEMDMTITQMIFTLNVHASFGQITGLVNRLLLKRFGYRKVTITGVTCVFFGLSLTSWVHNYVGFLITFGLIASLGVGLNTSSYTLAIKSYFVNKQNKAIGLSMTLTALGPILMPQIISLLVQNYHSDGVILILASIISHGYIGAFLLQPVKNHMRKIRNESKETTDQREDKIVINDEEIEAQDELMPQNGVPKAVLIYPSREYISNRRFPGLRRKDSSISISYEQETTGIMGLDSTLGGSLYSLESVGQHRASFGLVASNYQTKTTWWKSEDTIHLESSYDLFDEKSISHTKDDKNESENPEDKKEQGKSDKDLHDKANIVYKDLAVEIDQLPWYKRWFYQVVDLLGLDLFTDARYVNIMLGLSMALFVELNFTVLLPFLLDEYSLTISEMAAFLSILGAADILFRFIAPHIGDCFKLPTRVMFMMTLGFIICVRTALIFVPDYPYILIVASLHGCVKGLRVVYMSLVIPSYVPKERLAAASAIQIISNSGITLLGGYLLGVIRTFTGSYIYCIVTMNCITLSTILMWASDILYKKYRRKSKVVETSVGG